MSLFDRLSDQLDDDEEPSAGLTPLDIADLPDNQRKVMFALLRDNKAATEGIQRTALAEKLDHFSDLDETLAELVKSGWLIATGEAPNLRYKVNIRHKRSSNLGLGIWSSLSDRITQRMSELEDEMAQPHRKPALPSALLQSKPVKREDVEAAQANDDEAEADDDDDKD